MNEIHSSCEQGVKSHLAIGLRVVMSCKRRNLSRPAEMMTFASSWTIKLRTEPATPFNDCCTLPSFRSTQAICPCESATQHFLPAGKTECIFKYVCETSRVSPCLLCPVRKHDHASDCVHLLCSEEVAQICWHHLLLDCIQARLILAPFQSCLNVLQSTLQAWELTFGVGS